jgi:hypothetical protein
VIEDNCGGRGMARDPPYFSCRPSYLQLQIYSNNNTSKLIIFFIFFYFFGSSGLKELDPLAYNVSSLDPSNGINN